MAFQAVPNVAECNVIYTYNGILVQNTFYALHDSVYDLLDLQQLAGNVDGSVDTGWLSEQPIEAVYERTEVRGLTVENDLAATDNGGAGPGTDLSPAMPNQVTFSVKKTSGFTGRSARGRCYWIGIPQDKVTTGDENVLTSAYVALIVANVDLIRSGIEGLPEWSAVLVSRFTDNVKRPVGITFPWIDSVNVDDRVDTLRNRLS